MFLPINTFNIDEKFDYEFDHNLQFHPIAPPPLPHKDEKQKKKLHQFHMFCNKVEIIANYDKNYKWRERSMAQLWYSEGFPLNIY